MKSILVNVDPERLKADPELETQFLKLHGREALNKVYSDDEGYDFTEKQIENFSDAEYAQHREKIHEAAAKGRVK